MLRMEYKSLLQHHSSKASILWRSAFFIVRVSHPYVTTGKTIALTRQTFVGKVMSLLFNTLSRLVITFLLYQSINKFFSRQHCPPFEFPGSTGAGPRHMTTGKTIALTRRTLIGKVMSLLLNILSRLVITFLPRVSIF